MSSRKKIAATGGGIAAAIIIAVVALSGANVFVHNNPTQIQNITSSSAAQSNTVSTSQVSTSKLQIVAAENFWGSLISQLGGTHVQVLSIVTDPNADPHEYESNTADAQALTNANYVIVNGAGYDDWAIKIIGASNNPNQKVLNVAKLLGKKEGDNPHFWYSPVYVNQTVAQMYSDLVSIDPNNAAYYKQQYVNLNASLGQYNARIDEIKQQFAGTRVAATESIFVYLANATGLDLISPPEFIDAVAEGNDPPAQSVVQFQQQLQGQGGNVTVLVYNEQTVTPLTQNIKALAAQKGIPIVGVTETIQPSDVSFQDWMNSELISLQNALNAKALGQ
ncbi:MAG: zinc ABC transporter substrate-binding protein [Thaumarchaeota archaeon]|nr:zinc ABC transporter substrate-binding protein [Nitrososphaerota archaeon]MDE1866112.1 zinc ABC transporter substrate-binding protein [Nitrososphaerota archaeon]